MATTTAPKTSPLHGISARSRTAGTAAADAYAEGVGVVADLHVQLADATQSELLISVAGAQAQAARELARTSTAVTKTLLG